MGGRVDRDTDYPMAIGVVVGYSGLDIDLRTDFDWADAVIKAVVNTQQMSDEDRENMKQAMTVLLGIGTCTPAGALTRLRVRPAYE